MNAALSEIVELWDRLVEETATAEERARFDALLENPKNVELFANWQIKAAGIGSAAAKATAKSASKSLGHKAASALAKHAMVKAMLPWAAAVFVAGGATTVYVKVRQSQRAAAAVPAPQATPAPVVVDAPKPLAHPAQPSPVPTAQPTPAAAASAKKPKLGIVVKQTTVGAVSVRVLDMDGKLVQILYEGDLASGPWEFEWDGKDSQGQDVAAGEYRVQVSSAGVTREEKLKLTRDPEK